MYQHQQKKWELYSQKLFTLTSRQPITRGRNLCLELWLRIFWIYKRLRWMCIGKMWHLPLRLQFQILYFYIMSYLCFILLYPISTKLFCFYQRISLTTEPIWFSFKVKLQIGTEVVVGYFIFIIKSGYSFRLLFCS